MKRVTGIGGIFFKAKDPKALSAWYRQHLGVDVTDWGGAIFPWGGEGGEEGMTVWRPFKADTDYMSPSESSFMINYRVEDVAALLDVLREEGCQVVGEMQESEQGKFGWVMDPEGNKVELWQP